MSQAFIISVMRDAISTLLICALPVTLAALLVGVIVSIFQAATQINEQTLAFVPKIIATMLVLLLTFGFIITELTEFYMRMMSYAAQGF